MSNKKSNKAPAFTVVHFALILLCLVLVSTYATMGLHASYKSGASGTASARVAKFEVDVTGQPQNIDIAVEQDSNAGSYQIQIVNNSEVTVHYDLTLQFASGDSTGVAYSFSPQSADIAPGGSASSTLTFTVDLNEFTKNKTDNSATVNLSFVVTANVQQVD